MKVELKKGIALVILYVLTKWILIGVAGTYLYRKGLWQNWYLLLLPAIALIIFTGRKISAKIRSKAQRVIYQQPGDV